MYSCKEHEEGEGVTQDQFTNIQHGLCHYVAEPRFVARRGKEPINPLNGYGAKANDSATWGTLEQALAAVDKYKLDGIGIELGAGLCGLDLDHCVDEQGQISERAQEIINMMDSYTEISPSGTGIHILFSGNIPEGTRRKDGIEMYSEGRYFTVTGNMYELE